MARVPLTVDSVRAVMYGTLWGAQTWSVGVNIVFPNSPTPVAGLLDAYAEGLWTDAKGAANFRACMPYAPAAMVALGVKAYYYPNGSPVASQLGQSQSASMTGSAPAGNQHAPQNAIVATHLSTLLSSHARGRAYLPLNAAAIDLANGTFLAAITPVIATAWANNLSTWNLRRLNAKAGICSVVSTSTGGYVPITNVRVDNVTDTIRARRDKIIATSKSSIAVVVG